MENTQPSSNQNPAETAAQQQINSNNSKLIVIVSLSVLLSAVVSGSVVYFWQKSANEKAINNLEQKITSLEEQISKVKHEEAITKPTSPLAQSPTPTSPSEVDETASWKTFSSEKGYQLKYPTRLTHEERVPGFFVFLENQSNPNSVLFYIDERGEKTLAERKEWQKDNLTDIVYTDIPTVVQGFIVEGKLGLGYGQGMKAKSAYIDLNGRELIIGCDTNDTCQSQILNQVLSTFKFAD